MMDFCFIIAVLVIKVVVIDKFGRNNLQLNDRYKVKNVFKIYAMD